MPDITKALGKSLGLGNENSGLVDYFKESIKSYQGDGVSANTHAALREAGLSDVTHGDVKEGIEVLSRQTMSAPAKDATIVMPDGRRITPLQYQKLQKMLLKHGR